MGGGECFSKVKLSERDISKGVYSDWSGNSKIFNIHCKPHTIGSSSTHPVPYHLIYLWWDMINAYIQDYNRQKLCKEKMRNDLGLSVTL